MSKYVIVTDSSSNLTDELIKKYEIKVVPLLFVSGDNEYVSYDENKKTDLSKFYEMLRRKEKLSTTCVNQAQFVEAFKKQLDLGYDILYLGFSSALSGTYTSGEKAGEELKKDYPDRKIIAINTLGASLGEGLLVLKAGEMRLNNATLEETANWVEENKLKVCHYFTVDDLQYLYLGGRVKKSEYMIANMVHIKPLMHMDEYGRLVAVGKVIGRRKSLMSLADMVIKNIKNSSEQTICITHGDCIEDAIYLKNKIEDKIKVKEWIINYVDPVVGIHSGPGTMAIFFMGDHR